MNPLETEVVSHVTYSPEDPLAFQVSDDLLNADLGNTVVRLQRGLIAINNERDL